MKIEDRDLSAFAQELQGHKSDIDLARTALVMGRFEYPGLDVAAYLDRIDALAGTARPVLETSDLPALMLARFLFETAGFAGNTRDYADPRNSFLNEVIERRLGIPISLSVLYLEVARRTGIQAAGIGLPGHFIVRVELAQGQTCLLYTSPSPRDS